MQLGKTKRNCTHKKGTGLTKLKWNDFGGMNENQVVSLQENDIKYAWRRNGMRVCFCLHDCVLWEGKEVQFMAFSLHCKSFWWQNTLLPYKCRICRKNVQEWTIHIQTSKHVVFLIWLCCVLWFTETDSKLPYLYDIKFAVVRSSIHFRRQKCPIPLHQSTCTFTESAYICSLFCICVYHYFSVSKTQQ